MVYELRNDYKPGRFLHREEHIKEIKLIFEGLVKHGYGVRNLLLIGSSGSGKTSILNDIITQYRDISLYLNGLEFNTPHKIISAIKGDGKRRPISDVFQDIVVSLRINRKVIIIDEAHKIKDRDVLFNFLNEFSRQTLCPLILITNEFNFTNTLPPDALSSLNPLNINFRRYSIDELQNILMDRIEKYQSRTKETITEETKSGLFYLCSKVFKEGDSSARLVLNIAHDCFIRENFSQEFINLSLYNFTKDECREFVSNLKDNEKYFLEAMIDLTLEKDEITTSELLEHKNIKDMNLTPQRISQITTHFIDDYNILKAKKENLGIKGGSFRVLSFVSQKMRNNMVESLFPELIGGQADIETYKKEDETTS